MKLTYYPKGKGGKGQIMGRNGLNTFLSSRKGEITAKGTSSKVDINLNPNMKANAAEIAFLQRKSISTLLNDELSLQFTYPPTFHRERKKTGKSATSLFSQ